ncbi:hAT family dimerization protein [Rhizoctonia solani 123E]|uniref:HAT family dimerization protein n=1 Tax=Rhizoctonia solani 123E TaxID=1423351 RepID=A0A074RRN5_9AGAM|nr:hAT family dimerization protein [Rhizoctonia solani 123E]
MSPPCPQCVSRLFCTIHSRPKTPPPPPVPLQPKAVVPRSFTFYQPSVPVTLPKPIDELTREEIRALITKLSPQTSESSKRPVDSVDSNPSTNQSAPGPSKRQRKPVDESEAVILPPTIGATIPVGHDGAVQQRPRRVACECWGFMTGCETEEPPVGIARSELIAADIADFESRVFRQCQRPQSVSRIRCLLCWILFGRWKTWANGDGLTNRIREHLENHHHHEYHDKCQQEGVTVPSLNLTSVDDNTANLVFSPRLLAESLAQWVAIDDQRDEFRRILLLCGRAPNLREYEWAGSDTMGTINLVEFWKAHRNIFPLLYQIAMNVLPVQASSVSSERAFSSAKLTCTRERNNISAEHMEYLQVLKHSLHRRQANHNNNQTLDFMAHIVNPAGEESIDN